MQKNSGYFDESKSRNYLIISIISEQMFFQIWNLCKKKANNRNFQHRTNPVKACFGPIFWSIFRGAKNFSGKSGCHVQINIGF